MSWFACPIPAVEEEHACRPFERHDGKRKDSSHSVILGAMRDVLFAGTARVNNIAMPVIIEWQRADTPIHDGAWQARLDEIEGRITRAEANIRVASARVSRRLRRAKSRTT
jgi:hypothetical protein